MHAKIEKLMQLILHQEKASKEEDLSVKLQDLLTYFRKQQNIVNPVWISK